MATHARAHESVLAHTRLGKQVLPLLPALDEDTRRVQWLAVLAALKENKTLSAVQQASQGPKVLGDNNHSFNNRKNDPNFRQQL